MNIQDEELVVGSLKSLSTEDVAKLVTLSVVSRALNVSSDLRESLSSVLDSMMTALNADRGFIKLVGEDLELAIDRSFQPPAASFAYSKTLLQRCLAGEPILMLDAKTESAVQSAIVTGIRSVMVQPILSHDAVIGVIYVDNLLKAGRFQDNELRLLRIIADMVSAFIERKRAASALLEANRLLSTSAEETIFKLSRAAEFRDDEGGEHVQRVSHYCEAVALALGFTPAAAADIRMASQLHDVGKVGLPDSILLKTGRYTDHEREVMKQHTTIGAKILGGSSSPVIRLAEETALTHHEKWNGSGYPRGLAGEDIPLSGRIVAVADVFDALVTERRYKPGWSTERAFQLIEQEAGAHFDPTIAKTFLGLSARILEIRARFQPLAMAVPIALEDLAETEPTLLTRAQGRESLDPLRRAIDSISRGVGFNDDLRAQALKASRQLAGLLATQGLGLDFIRRLEGHFKRDDLVPEHAPRLSELLSEVESSLQDGTDLSGSVLLVDSDPRQRDALVVEASHRGISGVEAEDITAARAAILVCPPELVVLEVALPGALEFLEWLTKESPQIGVAILSSKGGIESRLEVAQRGGRLYLDKPLSAPTVFDEIQERLRAPLSESRPYRVLTLGKDAPATLVAGFELTSVNTLGQLWTSIQDERPDLLLLDLEMHLTSGLEMCKVLRADPRRGHLPVLALVAQHDPVCYRQALEAGADDVLVKPLSPDKLMSRLRTGLARDMELRQSSHRERLTGTAEVRVALRVAKHVFALAVKNSAPFTLCSITLDRFAELTQTLGRAKASHVLRQIADILERDMRPEDVLTHLEDGRFLIGLYGMTADAAAKRSESLNTRLGELFDGGRVHCTFSSASYPQDGTNLKQLVAKVGADTLLS